MRQWFNQLTTSEYRTIILGVIIVISALSYFLLWEPFVVAHKQLKNIVVVQKNNLIWMQTAANEIKQLRNNIPKKKSLLSLIDNSIRNSNLNKIDKRIEPKGNKEVLVGFASVSFTQLIHWLSKLYNQYQIQISIINIERQASLDQVKVQLTLQ
jgi:general secretion pathway protein M